MGSEQAIAAAGEPVRHLLTVEDFLTLDEAGAFERVGRVELIDGEIFVRSPLHLPHARALMELTIQFGLSIQRLDGTMEALTPVSARLDPHSLPDADIVIAASVGVAEGFVMPDMVRLVVEVADSSLKHDLGRKQALYARTGVPEYWVADVRGRRIIRMHDPVEGAYAARAEFAFGDMIEAATIAGLTIDTSRLA